MGLICSTDDQPLVCDGTRRGCFVVSKCFPLLEPMLVNHIDAPIARLPWRHLMEAITLHGSSRIHQLSEVNLALGGVYRGGGSDLKFCDSTESQDGSKSLWFPLGRHRPVSSLLWIATFAELFPVWLLDLLRRALGQGSGAHSAYPKWLVQCETRQMHL